MSARKELTEGRALSRRERIIEEIVAGFSDGEIAAKLGVSRSSVWRVRKDPSAMALIDERKTERLYLVVDRIVGAASNAAETLVQIMNDPETPPAVRIRAADSVLQRAGIGLAASELRYQTQIAAEFHGFTERLKSSLDDATLCRIVDALQNWEPKTPPPNRPRISIEFARQETTEKKTW